MRPVSLARALSKLGALSRSQAAAHILAGRVTVDGRPAHDPGRPVVLGQVRLAIDGRPVEPAGWRFIALHKPRGIVTTRSDPDGRPTVFDRLPPDLRRLVAIGRLDLATSGLLLFTSDTRLSDWLTDPRHGVPRTYAVTVRGELGDDTLARARAGVMDDGERLQPAAVAVRKRSRRETHLIVRLTEGRNREVRRLFEALGHDVTRLTRTAFGGLTLGDLPSGGWREVTMPEVRAAFPGAPVGRHRGPAGPGRGRPPRR